MKNFWINKNVFITGINGFIGSNLTKRLLAEGANVFGLIRNIKPDSFLFFEGLDKKSTLIEGDLLDGRLLERVISEENINIIFHLGAQVEVGVGMKNPFITFETNIRGTYNLMEAVHRHPAAIEGVIVASTDKSYGSYPEHMMPYIEDYPLKPKYPYDTSKACADMIAQCFANDVYRHPIVVTRFCNIFGPGQLNFSAIVPDAIRSALGYSTFIPRGNGQQIRDFIFVEDVSELYINIAASLSKNPEELRGQIFNAGTNSPIKMKDLIEQIFNKIGNEKDLKQVLSMMGNNKQLKGEIDCQYMNYDKAEKFLGWKPAHSLDSGLNKTIEWFNSYLKNKSSGIKNESRSNF